ncbi:hypothetical protein AOLI_G00256890 [Acnodon oligacanthus]
MSLRETVKKGEIASKREMEKDEEKHLRQSSEEVGELAWEYPGCQFDLQVCEVTVRHEGIFWPGDDLRKPQVAILPPPPSQHASGLRSAVISESPSPSDTALC